MTDDPTDTPPETEPIDVPADTDPMGPGRHEAGVTGGDARPARSKRTTHRRAAALIGVLLALLGFGIAVQVHSNSSSDSLSGLREDDLVHILDDQNLNADRLRQRIAELQNTLTQLQVSGDRDQVAVQQAQQEAQELAVLLGSVPVSGPGVTVTITDPKLGLAPEDLLDVVEELRGAGAEAIQFGSVRVGTSTHFTASTGGVAVDGVALRPPYKVLAIGDPKTLDTALNIPGGVAATARAAGGDAVVVESNQLAIHAVRSQPNPRYATPSGR